MERQKLKIFLKCGLTIFSAIFINLVGIFWDGTLLFWSILLIRVDISWVDTGFRKRDFGGLCIRDVGSNEVCVVGMVLDIFSPTVQKKLLKEFEISFGSNMSFPFSSSILRLEYRTHLKN